MRITLQCLYTQDWKDIAKISVTNAVSYCEINGYQWNVKCIDSPYNAFEKIKEIKRLFQDNLTDIVMSMDADTLITNWGCKVEDLVDSQHDVFISKDLNGINAGVFIVRKTDWSISFLDYLLSFEGIANCEQDAIDYYLAEEPINGNIKIIPQSKINAYKYELYPEFGEQSEENGQWIEGKSFILHLPAIGMDLRKELLSTTKITK